MNLPVNWGDVPTWLQAVGGIAQLGAAIWSIQVTRASEFARRLQSETGLDDGSMADSVHQNPEIASLTFQGLEASMRAAAQEKRWLLAKVVAASFRGDDARFDEVAVLLRTAAVIEPYDIRLLMEISKPRPDSFPDSPMLGAIRESELAGALRPDQSDLIAPVISILAREGLILNESLDTYYHHPAWSLTSYGHRFLHFLPNRSIASYSDTVVVGVHGAPRLLLKNLGPGSARVTHVAVTCDGAPLMTDPGAPIDLPAGGRIELPADDTVSPNGAATIDLCWIDEAGVECQSRRRHWRR